MANSEDTRATRATPSPANLDRALAGTGRYGHLLQADPSKTNDANHECVRPTEVEED